MKILCTILSLIFLLPTSSEAQIFNKIKKRAERQLAKKVEDRIVEEVSDAIVRAAYKPIDKAFDNMVKDAYGGDTLRNGEPDWDKINRNNSAMLQNFDASDKLPDFYNFDLYIDIETTDYDKNKTKSRMFYSTESALFAIEQKEDKETNFIVLDIDADLIAMYKDEDGEKTVQAIKNMLQLAGSYSSTSDYDDQMKDFKLEKTGANKTIAEYYCEEYKGENKDEDLQIYLATKFPIDWKDNYGGFIKKFMPATYSSTVNKMKGMIFYSENRLKEEPKKYALYEVKKVHNKSFKIDNADYKKIKFGE